WFLSLSVFFFGYAMYTYHAARVVAPLIGALGGILLLREWFVTNETRKSKTGSKILSLVFSVLLASAFVLPLLLNLKSSSVSSRFDATSIFTDPSAVLMSNEQIAKYGNTRVAKILYHRDWYYGSIILQGFLKHFSPQFLFVRGDGNLRHSTVAYGLLYPIDAFFILVALGTFVIRRDKRGLLLVFCILV